MRDPQPTSVPDRPCGCGNEPTREVLTQAATRIQRIDPDDPRWPIARPSTFDGSR